MATPTITLSGQPDALGPINSNLWYRLTSSSYTLPNWRYYADVYYGSATSGSTLMNIGRYKIPPAPNGDGLFSPHHVLREYITYGVNPLQPSVRTDENMSLAYQIAPGFGWDPRLSYGTGTTTGASRGSLINPTDYPTVIKPATFTFGGGSYYYLQLQTNNTSGGHGLLVGDTINISKDLKFYNGYYEGPCTVLSTGYTVSPTNLNLVTVNILYSDSTTVVGESTTTPSIYIESGIINDSIRINGVTSLRYAFGGTRQYDQQGLDFYTKYKVDQFQLAPSSSYLTPFDFTKEWKKIYVDNLETISLLNRDGSTNSTTVRMRTYDVNQTLTGTNYYSITPTAIGGLTNCYYHMQVGYGAIVGSGSVLSYPAYYDLSIGAGTGGSGFYSIVCRYQIIQHDCLYTNTRICWLNKLGGYDYFNFSKENVKSVTSAKKEFIKQLPWNYSVGDRQDSVLSTSAQASYLANTDWLTDNEYAFMEDLITSPDVYLIQETGWILSPLTAPAYVKYPIIITDTSYKEKTQLKDRVYNMQINYKLSNKINIQSL